jgi:Arc/MetJ-type ribon-helix-helix transcriptional regulator
MPKTGNRSLTVPENLYQQLKHHVDASQRLYVSTSEVVREVIWTYLKTYPNPSGQ